MKYLGMGAASGLIGIFGSLPKLFAANEPDFKNDFKVNNTGLPIVKIRSVKAFALAPDRANLIIVKVETSEPGLYGLGCATFTQRAHLVVSAVNKYLNEYCIGRDVDNIEDIWNSIYVSSYWRNGPVLNNALSGLDEALWDIKGKRANMPLYQLLGGKSRFALETYAHVNGRSPEEVAENSLNFMEKGFKTVRVSIQENNSTGSLSAPFKVAGFGNQKDGYKNLPKYLKEVPQMFQAIRKRCGEDVGIIHDIHEQIEPMDAINMCKRVEEFKPFFMEDPLSPENTSWWKQLRASTTVPLAMGELFNNINEFLEPVTHHYFDYIRCHVSQVGGITPAMKIAKLCEWFNIKTAWHAPGDCSPVGHAAYAHIDFAVWNFGIQETVEFSEKLKEIFPGHTYVKDGYMFVNEAPGLGIDFNEKLAAKYPISETSNPYGQIRKADGTMIRP